MLAQAPRPPAAKTGTAPPDRRAQNVSGRPLSPPPSSRPSNSRPPDSRPSDSRPPDSRPPDSRPPDSRPPDSRAPSSRARDSRARDSRPACSNGHGKPAAARKDAEHEILFQKYFKSVNPQRTYAAQVKKAGNGNH